MIAKEVKKLMIDRDLHIRDLAEKTGFTPGHISGVINGRYASRRARISIALVLGRDVRDLWPETSSQAS